MKKNHKLLLLPFILLISLFIIISTISALTGSISPSRFVLTGSPGEQISKYLTINNPNNISVNIILNLSGNLAPDIKLSNFSFTLAPNESKKDYFNITSYDTGTNEGYINVKFTDPKSRNSVFLSSRITLTTEQDSYNAEITAVLSPETPEAISGEDLIILTNIKNTGTQTTTYNVSIKNYESFADLISINPNQLTLSPQQSSQSTINLNLKENSMGYQEFIILSDYNGKSTEQIIGLDIYNDSNPSNNGNESNNSSTINLTQFDNRLSILESWKSFIISWKNTITETINSINNKLNNHELRLLSLENKSSSETKNYFKYLSSTDRKSIVCSYAIENNLAHYEDIGFSCDVTYRTNLGKTKGTCRCSEVK